MAKKTNYLRSPERLQEKKKDYCVFLAGPIQGAPDWRGELLNQEWPSGVLFLDPAQRGITDFNHQDQVDWETDYLNLADEILFWIPEEAEKIPGRDYAQTTRAELGEWLAKSSVYGKKLIIGIHKDFPGRQYFVERATRDYGVSQIYDSFESLLSGLRVDLKVLGDSPRTWFTSDTHFGSERALEYSKRPFRDVKEMDRAMICHWNSLIKPGDTVWHLGDFGNYEIVKYLNGNINLLFGNYEEDEAGTDRIKLHDRLIELGFSSINIKGRAVLNMDWGPLTLAHKPTVAKKEYLEDGEIGFVAFGHIHGRQKVKPFGIDVGVDGNGYKPYSDEDLRFYKEAIEKYYDDDVFIS